MRIESFHVEVLTFSLEEGDVENSFKTARRFSCVDFLASIEKRASIVIHVVVIHSPTGIFNALGSWEEFHP